MTAGFSTPVLNFSATLRGGRVFTHALARRTWVNAKASTYVESAAVVIAKIGAAISCVRFMSTMYSSGCKARVADTRVCRGNRGPISAVFLKKWFDRLSPPGYAPICFAQKRVGGAHAWLVSYASVCGVTSFMARRGMHGNAILRC